MIPTRYGPLQAPRQEDDMIVRFLRRDGEWGWDEARFVAGCIPDQARVLDVGAFLGTFGLGLAQCRTLGGLCAVEANPAVAPLLAANLRRNAPCPAVAVDAVVTGLDSIPSLGRVPPGNLAAASFAPGAAGDAIAAPARAVTLAELHAEHGPFDLVKLDAEGMEEEILRGGGIPAPATTLWVECNEDPRSLDVGALLLAWGLELHYFAFPSHNPGNHNGDPDPIFPWAFEAGLLAAPHAPPALDAAMQRNHCILRRIRTVEELREAMWRTPRWGMADWPAGDPAALAALAGRTLRNEAPDSFLRTGAPLGSRGNEMIWQRLQAAEAELARLHAAAGR